MNTHDKIELPPLPEDLIASMMIASEVRSLMRRYGKRCATAAIEADRKRRGEPVAFAKDGNLFWHGDHRAWREFSGELYLAPQPADPVRMPSDADEKAREALWEAYESLRELEKQIMLDAHHISGAQAANFAANRIRTLLARYGKGTP